MRVTHFVVIEAEASPVSYGKTLETIFADKHHVAGLIECGNDRVFIEGLHKVMNVKERDGKRVYILEKVPL